MTFECSINMKYQSITRSEPTYKGTRRHQNRHTEKHTSKCTQINRHNHKHKQKCTQTHTTENAHKRAHTKKCTQTPRHTQLYTQKYTQPQKCTHRITCKNKILYTILYSYKPYTHTAHNHTQKHAHTCIKHAHETNAYTEHTHLLTDRILTSIENMHTKSTRVHQAYTLNTLSKIHMHGPHTQMQTCATHTFPHIKHTSPNVNAYTPNHTHDQQIQQEALNCLLIKSVGQPREKNQQH